MVAKPRTAPAFVVWNGDDIDQALAMAKGRAALLLSPPAAFGAPYFSALIAEARKRHPKMSFSWALDCDERAGLALAALRAGAPAIVYCGGKSELKQIRDVARQMKAMVISPRPASMRLPRRRAQG